MRNAEHNCSSLPTNQEPKFVEFYPSSQNFASQINASPALDSGNNNIFCWFNPLLWMKWTNIWHREWLVTLMAAHGTRGPSIHQSASTTGQDVRSYGGSFWVAPAFIRVNYPRPEEHYFVGRPQKYGAKVTFSTANRLNLHHCVLVLSVKIFLTSSSFALPAIKIILYPLSICVSLLRRIFYGQSSTDI